MRLSTDTRFDLQIIVFGTHLLEKYGYTIQQIKQDDFGKIYEVPGMPDSDNFFEIASGYGEIVKVFANFWVSHHFDWVVALGDRFEMSAAVQASIPFELKIAHIHGGETTLGATDNIYRHQISLVSKLHFVSSNKFKEKVIRLTGETKQVYNFGALSLDGIEELILPDWQTVSAKFNIPDLPFALVTFHPETVGADKNKEHAKVIYKTLELLSKYLYIVVTMTNADLLGSCLRDVMLELKLKIPSTFSAIENFGKENYFTAMKASKYLLGNTSSGIVEAASFGKFVINVGDRQKGRLRNENVKDVPFNVQAILRATKEVEQIGNYKGVNRFYQQNTALQIIEVIANA